ncbi:calcium-binding protein [Salipiger bermudensis]|nr:calcium-binding protein [Salipiger bermudensis]
MIGGSGDDNLRGEIGANELWGEGGNDWLFGRWGDDTLHGGTGNDVMRGGSGADVLDGGAGRDVADYRDSFPGLRIDMANPSRNTGISRGDSYRDVEDLAGTLRDDNLSGDAQGNRINGRLGNDRLYGRAGHDTLDGGAGNDVLEGGTGRDSFVFTGGQDTISDFATGSDTLLIDPGLTGESLEHILQSARVVDGDLTLSIGGGHSLTLSGIGDTGLVEPGLEWL